MACVLRHKSQLLPYLALWHLGFESVAVSQEALKPHAAQIVGDVANYINGEPAFQISTAKI
jgi:hypothetical protein